MGSITDDGFDPNLNTNKTWPLQVKPHRDRSNLTAVVKGGGPSGLAAAISLAQEGFLVKVVEKRSYRPLGQGRKNMVALRPEALRILDQFGALQSLLESDTGYGLTRMVEGTTTNHWVPSNEAATVFEWPLKRYPPAEPESEISKVEEYEIPQKVNEQVPSSFVNLGDLEDCLSQSARRLGVSIVYEGTINLTKDEDRLTKRYRATLTSPAGYEDLGFPDLIVCASGKGDLTIEEQLKFHRRIGVQLTESNLPIDTSSRELRFDSEHELESQFFSVYGIKTPSSKMGVIDHNILKPDNVKPSQPVVEIEMRHAMASHLLLQLPRGMDTTNSTMVEEHIVARTNDKLETDFDSVRDMKEKGCLVWGDPLKPVTVETSTAPTYVFGSNVVLIGDAAMSCSPSSGLGAEVGMTVDSQNIRQLAQDLVHTRKADKKELSVMKSQRQQALDLFNMRKAESAVLWSQGSRMFYLTTSEVDELRSHNNDGEATEMALGH